MVKRGGEESWLMKEVGGGEWLEDGKKIENLSLRIGKNSPNVTEKP